jgi:hypothetical protein
MGAGFATGAGYKPRGTYNKDKPAKAMLKRLLSEAGAEPYALQDICLKLIAMAKDGNLEAINLLLNRLDGYPIRPVANEGDVPLFLNVTWLTQPPKQVDLMPETPAVAAQPIQPLEDHAAEPADVRGDGRPGEPE